MKDRKNLFSKFLSLITYEKPRDIKEFYIPEVKEASNDFSNDRESADESRISCTKAADTDKPEKGIKKPISVDEQKKEKKCRIKADENTISTDIDSNLEFLKKKFNSPDNKDIVLREFVIAEKYRAFIAYIDGMADRVTINNFILRPLLKVCRLNEKEEGCQLDFILNNVVETNQTSKITTPEDAVYEILQGDTILYIDGCDFYVTNETRGFDRRNVDKPLTEGVVIGPQEAFNETLRTNITLVRKIIKNSKLTTEFMKVGGRNQNLCAILYIKGLTNPAIINEVKRRIRGIKTDSIIGDGMLEQFIEDSPYSAVPTVLTTERPDRTAAHIMEGKVAILIENAPFAKIVPVTLPSLLHSPEDTALRWEYGSFLRIIRVIAAFISTLLPGLYVAITDFHQEMIPTDLLIAIAKAKENVPFPTIIEVLLMEISFELIREAGIRIPGIIGNTLGIIGALILGQAAVQANIVSPVLIIVVAITGLGNFAIPNFSLSFSARIYRFIFIFAGGALGFLGISVALMITTALILNTKSFGIPYLASVAPRTRRSYDVFMRWPVWKQELRPDSANPLDIRRQPDVSRQWAEENPEYDYNREDEDD